MSSLSRFQRSDIRIFELEKTRSHSAVIASIDRRSKAICNKECHGAKAKYIVQTLVLIQEELTKEESKNRTQREY